MNTRPCIAIGCFAALFSFLAAPVWAVGPAASEGAIPSAAVARLKIDSGTAWVRSPGSGDWEEAQTNYPLVEQSRLSVPQGSEAEVQFHGNQMLHLRGGTEVDIQQLGEQEVAYRLLNGQADLSLAKEDFAPVRVNVPGNRNVRVDLPGRYSLSVDGETTTFVVRSGEGAVSGGEGSPVIVREGEEASIGDRILVSRTEYPVPEEAPPPELTGPEEESGVPPEVAGELAPYGEWVPTPEYGYAWRPYVDEGWEPYYYGRWVWISPYGWTWVAYEPWGWWPYHTGWWWPSPVYGWVWCPFHSFVSFDFVFGRHTYFGYHARFFPGNVRFYGRGGFARWRPARPGRIESRSRFSSRDDIALARWNRPVDRGSVMFRGAGGRLAAWEGRRTPMAAAGVHAAQAPGVNRVGTRAAISRGGSAMGSRSRNFESRLPSARRGTGASVSRSPYAARAPMTRSAGVYRRPAPGGNNSYRGYRGSYTSRSRGESAVRAFGGGGRQEFHWGGHSSFGAERRGFSSGERGSFDGGHGGFGGGGRGYHGR